MLWLFPQDSLLQNNKCTLLCLYVLPIANYSLFVFHFILRSHVQYPMWSNPIWTIHSSANKRLQLICTRQNLSSNFLEFSLKCFYVFILSDLNVFIESILLFLATFIQSNWQRLLHLLHNLLQWAFMRVACGRWGVFRTRTPVLTADALCLSPAVEHYLSSSSYMDCMSLVTGSNGCSLGSSLKGSDLPELFSKLGLGKYTDVFQQQEVRCSTHAHTHTHALTHTHSPTTPGIVLLSNEWKEWKVHNGNEICLCVYLTGRIM